MARRKSKLAASTTTATSLKTSSSTLKTSSSRASLKAKASFVKATMKTRTLRNSSDTTASKAAKVSSLHVNSTASKAVKVSSSHANATASKATKASLKAANKAGATALGEDEDKEKDKLEEEEEEGEVQVPEVKKRGSSGAFKGAHLRYLQKHLPDYGKIKKQAKKSAWLAKFTKQWTDKFPWHTGEEPAEFAPLNKDPCPLPVDEHEALLKQRKEVHDCVKA
ncbi:hypothetical protein BT96DRAFT_989644 [Gymnopus androsaceus JB14]|uniref:Uncharacterized protein n=1 Tax=Gymnopus androsaceus JB14 TaxID=1447944 RepID=A0A6A4HXT1_9AGAR|nr:hypothetical protein BT96DRAFT_989644 [Gymnopus androsaceus JB14]